MAVSLINPARLSVLLKKVVLLLTQTVMLSAEQSYSRAVAMAWSVSMQEVCQVLCWEHLMLMVQFAAEIRLAAKSAKE